MMLVFLKCNSSTGDQQLALRWGQRARVGSSEWMELSVPAAHLQPEHFVVDFRDTLQLQCTASCTVELAGQLVSQAELQHGTTFRAADCRFEIATCGSINKRRIDTQVSETEFALPPHLWWQEVDWTVVDCPSQKIPELQQHATIAGAVEQLRAAGQMAAALRLVANRLSPVACVEWAQEAIEDHPEVLSNPKHSASMAQVKAWLMDPSEPCRQQIVVDSQLQLPSHWIAQAVAWTGGSLAPSDAPLVPPPKSLCGIACATALQLYLASGDAERSIEEILAMGLQRQTRAAIVVPAENQPSSDGLLP